MPRLRLGLMSLLLLPATRRFSRGGPWMWAPFGLSGSLVALVDAFGPEPEGGIQTAVMG